MEGNDIM